VKTQVDGCVSEGKLLISKTKDRYTTTQQLVPIDIGQQVSSYITVKTLSKLISISDYMKKMCPYRDEY
jgi:hypothetical protein